MRTAHLREVYSRALELLAFTRYGRILTDHQLMTPILPPDAEWLMREWVPLAIKAGGCRHCAVIQNHKQIGRQITRKIAAQFLNTSLIINYLHDRTDAIAWMLAEQSTS